MWCKDRGLGPSLKTVVSVLVSKGSVLDLGLELCGLGLKQLVFGLGLELCGLGLKELVLGLGLEL